MPICCPSSSSDCIGVVECSSRCYNDLHIFSTMNMALQEVGLSLFVVQERIPYKTINGLKPARDKIEEALMIVCESHNISLAQVWIAYVDETHLPFSSSSEATETKRMSALKLTGYYNVDEDSQRFKVYNDACDIVPLKLGKELNLKTLQDFQPHFCEKISTLSTHTLMAWASTSDDDDDDDGDDEGSGFAICLSNIDTNDFCYVFEFIWSHNSNYAILLESLPLTLKRYLPHSKFASGAELGDELHVIDVDISTKSETKKFMIFQENRLSPIPEAMEKGKKAMVVDHRTHKEVKCKTAKIPLPREVIQQQFGNTMKEAAENLHISLSTLKWKLKVYGITEWQGPDLRKRKVYDSFDNQNCTNEKEYGAIQDPLSINRDENTPTLKAEYADDMIKFDLPISEATFDIVKKEICTRLDLTFGTLKLKDHDDVGDCISLLSDKDMYHMKSLKKLNKKVVRLCVCHTRSSWFN